jgi:hypothetical protein
VKACKEVYRKAVCGKTARTELTRGREKQSGFSPSLLYWYFFSSLSQLHFFAFNGFFQAFLSFSGKSFPDVLGY